MARKGAMALRSGELAHATGVSADTIRHYEKIGVLPKAERTGAGYRLYPSSTVERVLAAQKALGLGFTLKELSEVFRLRDTGGVPCHRVYELARQKLMRIGKEIEELKKAQDYLRNVLLDWEKRIQKKGRGDKAYLLHTLSNAPNNPRGRNSLRRK